jgi:uncharacterized protein YjiS (DUF1127 family)
MGITFIDLLRDRLSSDAAAIRLIRFVNVLELAMQVRRERRQLAALGGQELRDMGIKQSDAMREAGRDLFDVPKSRLDRL